MVGSLGMKGAQKFIYQVIMFLRNRKIIKYAFRKIFYRKVISKKVNTPNIYLLSTGFS